MRNYRVVLLLVILTMIFSAPAAASESDYAEAWCKNAGGKAELRFDDRTRCDCITAEHAVEVEFAKKWYQAVGQSLHYGLKAGKTPGIVMIIGSDKDMKYVKRLQNVIEYYRLDITVWLMNTTE